MPITSQGEGQADSMICAIGQEKQPPKNTVIKSTLTFLLGAQEASQAAPLAAAIKEIL